MVQVRRVEDVVVGKKNMIHFLFVLLLSGTSLFSQELPDDELQVNLNSYFDNFNVQIVYPSISLTKRYQEHTTLNFRYLIDVISAASMKSHFDVDGVTSATEADDGGGDNTPDEIRQEFGIGVTEVMHDGLLKNATISLNVIYSAEHDYSSKTLAGTIAYQMAKKNTTLQFGFVKSWDKIFPQIRIWERNKDVLSLSFNVSQILSTKAIAQFIYSYSEMKGYLPDAYQVVTIINADDETFTNYEPIHPDSRFRRALGFRVNYKAGRVSSLNAGLRYYSDSWKIKSFTTSLGFQRHLGKVVRFGLLLRHYTQSKAFFFQSTYSQPEPLMAVDAKLNKSYSNDYQFKISVNGGHLSRIPLLANPKVQFNFRLNFYHRHSETPDWHSRSKNLYAYIVSTGVRYKL